MGEKLAAAAPGRTAMGFTAAIAGGLAASAVLSWSLVRSGYLVGRSPALFAAGVALCFLVAGWFAGASLGGSRKVRAGFALGAAIGLTLTVVPLFALQGYSGRQPHLLAGFLLYGTVGAVAFGIMGMIAGAFLGEGWRGIGSCAVRLAAAGAVGGGVAGMILIGGAAMAYATPGSGATTLLLSGVAAFYLLPAAVGGWLLGRRSSRRADGSAR